MKREHINITHPLFDRQAGKLSNTERFASFDGLRNLLRLVGRGSPELVEGRGVSQENNRK